MLGLCLVAALALGAYAVSSASALPEFGKCEAKAGGKYANSNCTEKAKKGTGAYEWLKAAQVEAKRQAEGKSKNVPFTGASVGSGGVLYGTLELCQASGLGVEVSGEQWFEAVTRQACYEKTVENSKTHEVSHGGRLGVNGATLKIECEAERNSGEVSGKKSISNVAVTFTGCKLSGVLPCQSGSTEGEVVVNTLKGTLGYLSKSEKKVGLLLEPAKKHGDFAKFECGKILETIVGVGNSKEGAFFLPSGCLGACVGTTPTEEKHGGYDGIISPITPVNQMTSTYEQVFKVGEGVATASPEWGPTTWKVPFNEPTKFEGKHIDALEQTIVAVENGAKHMWGGAGEEITNVNNSEEIGEIKA